MGRAVHAPPARCSGRAYAPAAAGLGAVASIAVIGVVGRIDARPAALEEQLDSPRCGYGFAAGSLESTISYSSSSTKLATRAPDDGGPLARWSMARRFRSKSCWMVATRTSSA